MGGVGVGLLEESWEVIKLCDFFVAWPHPRPSDATASFLTTFELSPPLLLRSSLLPLSLAYTTRSRQGVNEL